MNNGQPPDGESVLPSPNLPLPATPAHDHTGTGPFAGQRIGRFHISREIGSGGASTVYQAFDAVDERDVALKVMHPGADAVARQRFRQEMEIVSHLQHPHIVHTYQVGEFTEHRVGYIAMELVHGETLATLARKKYRFSYKDACTILVPVASALAYAHEEKLVHRDVKPSNILLRPSTSVDANHIRIAALDYPFVPLLSDFGIAWAFDTPEITVAGRTVGSPIYMSPEQCSGDMPVDRRTDIYALGLVLYRCIIGNDLFSGTTSEVLYKHVHVAFDESNADLQRMALPLPVLQLLQCCLAKDPDMRIQTAAELAAALDVLATSTDITTVASLDLHDPSFITRTMPQLDTSPKLGQEQSLGSDTAADRPDDSPDRRPLYPRLVAVGLLAAVLALVIASPEAMDTWNRWSSNLQAGVRATDTPAAPVPESRMEPEKSPMATELPGVVPAPTLPSRTPPAEPYAIVNTREGVNIREGPGQAYRLLGVQAYQGRLRITGIDVTGDWWAVEMARDPDQPALRGWVYGELVNASNTRSVPEIMRVSPVPPTATVQPAAALTPRSTATPIFTPTPTPLPALAFATICRDFGLHQAFRDLFEHFNAYADFGCQTSVPRTGPMQIQAYQWGELIFMLKTNRVYVTLVLDDNTDRHPQREGAQTNFFRYPAWDFVFVSPSDLQPATQDDGDGTIPEINPDDFFTPFLDLIDRRTANRVISLRSRLGAPLGPSRTAEGVIQSFDRGIMIMVDAEDKEPIVLQLGKLERIDVQ